MRTIVHISDIHFGRVDPVVAEGLMRDIADGETPTLLVMSGDFTQRARARQFQDAAPYMARLPQPQLVVPGNHDIPLHDLVRRFFFPLSRYRRFISRDVRPVFRDEELLVMGVNSARSFSWTWDGFWKDGSVSDEQLLGIRSQAGDVPGAVFKVVVTHHPFIPPPGERAHGIVHRSKQALAVFEACGIDMLLAGHLHMGYSGDVRTHHEAVKRSILSVQAGTAISTRRRGEPNAYNRIRIEKDLVTIDVRTWDGTKFVDGARTRFGRADGIWNKTI